MNKLNKIYISFILSMAPIHTPKTPPRVGGNKTNITLCI